MNKIGTNLGELMDTVYPVQADILGSWLKVGNLVLIFAPRGMGKTFFGLSLATSIATGLPFLKWTPPCRRRVLLADGEMGLPALQQRLMPISGDVQGDFINILSISHFDSEMPNLSTPGGQKIYEEAGEGCSVLIIDNLLTCSGPVDHKDTEVMVWSRIQKWAIKMRKSGKSIVFIHHAGKSGLQMGTSMRENIMDTIISMRRPANSKEITGFEAELSFEKTRAFYGKDAEPLYIKHIDADGIPVWSWGTLIDKMKADVISMQRTGLTVTDISAALGIKPHTVKTLLSTAPSTTNFQDKEDDGQELF